MNNLSGRFLSYQTEIDTKLEKNDILVIEKGRGIGMTYKLSHRFVLAAAQNIEDGGKSSQYMTYDLDLAREFIEQCHARAVELDAAVRAIDIEPILDERTGEEVPAFRLPFKSGNRIIALASRPRKLRGKHGWETLIDEAAFMDDVDEVLKAAQSLTIWGGKVIIMSTHNGVDNPFNTLVQDIRGGRWPDYSLMRVPFRDAVGAGLYKKICAVKGEAWSAERQADWVALQYRTHGDNAGEELDCIPSRSAGKYLSLALLEAATAPDIPIVRWEEGDDFLSLSLERRAAVARDWCRENLTPVLADMAGAQATYVGEDFGRSGDLTVLWPLVRGQNLRLKTPFLVELRNIPYEQQRAVLLFLLAGLPGFRAAAMDAAGNGGYLAEAAAVAFGNRIAGIKATREWYATEMPRLKAALEDGTLTIPADADVIDDLRAIEVRDGVPGIPRGIKTGGKRGDKRHGDAAIALCMALAASRQSPVPIEFESWQGETGAVMQGYGLGAGSAQEYRL
ncbi:MAG: hypothetical protein AAF442_05375 [Pseudomonadota bacterium]